MENKSISLSIDEAKYMYDSNDEVIRNIALKAYSKEQLSFDFTKIKTFEDACKALGLDYKKCLFKADAIANDSKASAAMYKLNIVRKALNLGQDLHLRRNPGKHYIHYPSNPLKTKGAIYHNNQISPSEMEVIGKIKSEVVIAFQNKAFYNVMNRIKAQEEVVIAFQNKAFYNSRRR